MSAQNFWFWPTTQMFAILKHLLLADKKQDREIDIIRNNTTSIFFDNFVAYNKISNIRLIDEVTKTYDTYIGIYDPYVIFEWKKRGKQTIFFCNLWFLWSSDTDIDRYMIDSNYLSIDELIDKYSHNHHNMIFLAYILCDSIYYRSTDGKIIQNDLFVRLKDKITLLWPIIYPRLYQKQANPDKLLFQLGWQVNPISSESFYELYFDVIKKILSWLDKKLYYDKIYILVNKEILSLAETVFDWWKVLPTMPQEEYQILLSQTKALFHPFGINTFFESICYDVPNFILPEQHIWHIKSLIQYTGDMQKIDKSSILMYSMAKYQLSWENEIVFIDFLKTRYKTFLDTDYDFSSFYTFLEMPKHYHFYIWEVNINDNIDILLNEIVS